MDNENKQEPNSITLNGRRYFGHKKINIPTNITIEGQNIHIKIRLKTKRDFEFQTIEGKRDVRPVETDIKREEYSFKKTDVRNVEMSKRFLWYTTDYIMLAIALIAAIFTKGLFLLVGAFYIFFFVRCHHLIIKLNSGQEIKIPISYLLTNQEEIAYVKTILLSSSEAGQTKNIVNTPSPNKEYTASNNMHTITEEQNDTSPLLQNQQIEKAEYEMTGNKGRIIGYSTDVITKIILKGSEISINTINENSAAPSNCVRFSRKDIAGVSFKKRFGWNWLDILLFPILLAAFSVAIAVILFGSTFSLLLTIIPVSVVIVIWEAYIMLMSMSVKFVITLYNGRTIKIPIDEPLDAKPFLEEIQYPCDIPTPRRHSQFYKSILQSRKRKMAIIGTIAAILISLAGTYFIHLADGLLNIQTWDISSEDSTKKVSIKDSVQYYCGSNGHWSAKRYKVEEDGTFKKGDICIEVTYIVSDYELGDSEIRFLYGYYKGIGLIWDVTYLKLFDTEYEGDDIYEMFFHMRDLCSEE